MRTTPLFRHDCKHCIYCGSIGNISDIYECPNAGDFEGTSSIICRYSSEGSDYYSTTLGISGIEKMMTRYDVNRKSAVWLMLVLNPSVALNIFTQA